MAMLIILLIFLLIQIFLKPRIDITENNKILIWYGKIKRKYFILF